MASAALPFERHHMVRADPSAWTGMLASRRDLADEPLLIGWAERRWPLIVRRPVCKYDLRAVPLGLALPPASGRRRLELRFSREDLTDCAAPPRLAEAVGVAPKAWRKSIASLIALDAEVRCFGSLAWQHLTGLAYLTAASDLDLLWRVASARAADALAAQIAEIAERAHMRIDGEFITPGGLGVQWREWRSAARELVAKGHDGVRLLERAELLQ